MLVASMAIDRIVKRVVKHIIKLCSQSIIIDVSV